MSFVSSVRKSTAEAGLGALDAMAARGRARKRRGGGGGRRKRASLIRKREGVESSLFGKKMQFSEQKSRRSNSVRLVSSLSLSRLRLHLLPALSLRVRLPRGTPRSLLHRLLGLSLQWSPVAAAAAAALALRWRSLRPSAPGRWRSGAKSPSNSSARWRCVLHFSFFDPSST